MKRWIGIVTIVLIALFALLQLFNIPTLAQQTNPPVQQTPNWDSQQTQQLAQRACYDCHSNQTNWPFYSRVAPVSWFVTPHVLDARAELNFTEWGQTEGELEDIGEVVPRQRAHAPNYYNLHPNAVLSEQEQQQLLDGLRATISGTGGEAEGGEAEEEEYEEYEDE
jgi:mono/diheme cytochrome c family protein